MKDYYYDLRNKKKRNKDLYMESIYESRKKAADFALKGKMNKGSCYYKKPINYISEKDKNEKSNNKNVNNKDKHKYYKSYTNLKNNLNGEAKSINSFLIDSSDNRNNYINNKKEDDELFNILLTDEEMNKKYNNLKKHSINMSSDNNHKKKNDYFNDKNNNKIYEIQLTSPSHDENKNNKKFSKKTYEIKLTSPSNDKNKNKKYSLLNNNKNEFDFLSNKINNRICFTTNINNKQRNFYEHKIYYIEGEENHRFYDSSGINDYSYNYESYKVKKYYKFKNDKKEEYDNNFNDIDNKDKKSKMSPIKNEIKNEDNNYSQKKDINESKLKNVDNCHSQSKEINNNKLKNKYLILNNCPSNDRYINLYNSNRNNQRQKSEDLQKDSHIITTIRESENTKAISIIYKSQNKSNNLNSEIKEKEIKSDNNDNKDILDNNMFEDKKIMSRNKYKNKQSISNKEENNEKTNLKINNYISKDEIENKNLIKNTYDIFGLNKSSEKQNLINKFNNNNKKLNYNLIKERYESYLRKRSEKEPSDKHKEMNYEIQNSMRNNFVNSIKDKIIILKTNRNNEGELADHNYEIDNNFKKLKEKETSNNLLKKYYDEIFEKEDNNIINNNIKDGKIKNKMKKKIFQKSNRLQNSVKKFYNNKNYKNLVRSQSDLNQINYTSTNYSSYLYSPKENKKNISIKELKAKKNNIKELKNNIHDINLVEDKKQLKIMDEKDYEKLKNSKSTRKINKNKYLNFSNRKDLIKYKLRKSKFGSSDFIFSPKSFLFYFENKIMPPNEI